MPTTTAKKLVLASVQTNSVLGQIRDNLGNAQKHVQEAARQGAQLVVLPEMLPSGSTIDPQMWNYAEPAGGETETWLRELAGSLSIYLGVSYLQAEGEHYFNTFALAGPTGAVAGRVRKHYPAFSENFYFRAGAGAPYIDTEIGRVGVGICNDNHLSAYARLLASSSPDLLLMPHAWPLPFQTGKAISQEDIDRQRRVTLDLAPLYARLLGIPVVMVNHCGPCPDLRPPGLVARLLPPAECYRYPGLAVIADSDGQTLTCAGAEEGFTLAEVVLDPHRKHSLPVPDFGGRLYPGPAGRKIVLIDESLGKLHYTLSRERRRKARAVSSR